MIRFRLFLFIFIGVLLLALSSRGAHAASSGPLHSPLNCDHTFNNTSLFRGTINVYSGIQHDCVVQILGGATLRAGGGTAPQIQHVTTRAVFRVTGSGLDAPGGVTIVVGASKDKGNAPETHDLYADATLTLKPGTVLVRYDFARNKYVAVPNGVIRRTLVTYKIIRSGTPALPGPAQPGAPATLPATGGGPLRAVPLVGGALLLLRRGRARARPRRARARAGGAVLIAVFGVAYTLMQRQGAAVGFGALAATQGPAPRQDGALGAPTRLAIPALGIDTGMTALGVAGGAWQVPSYGAGYLAGTAFPGQVGNEAIAGHDDRDGAVFRRLGDLHAGDEVRVYASARAYRYRVTALRVVPPAAVDVLRPTRGATLTLITCTPYLVDTDRLVARAELIQ